MNAIPVCADDSRGIQRVVELADDIRTRQLAKAPNAAVIRRRKTGEVVRIKLRNFSDDSSLEVHRSNPRRYSHDHETEQNPPRVWTLRKLPSGTRDIYRASVLDCMRKAA